MPRLVGKQCDVFNIIRFTDHTGTRKNSARRNCNDAAQEIYQVTTDKLYRVDYDISAALNCGNSVQGNFFSLRMCVRARYHIYGIPFIACRSLER